LPRPGMSGSINLVGLFTSLYLLLLSLGGTRVPVSPGDTYVRRIMAESGSMRCAKPHRIGRDCHGAGPRLAGPVSRRETQA